MKRRRLRSIGCNLSVDKSNTSLSSASGISSLLLPSGAQVARFLLLTGMLKLLLLFLFADHLQRGLAFGSLGTVGTLWTQWNDGNNPKLGGVPGQYALCALQAGELTPGCDGPFLRNNNTQAPSAQAFFGINSGDSFTCGLLYGTMFPACWGSRKDSNVSVPDNLRGVRYSAMSVGGFHVCALTGGGDVNCWGSNFTGEAQPPASVRFASLASGMSYSCGLSTAGAAVCWGAPNVASLAPADSSFDAIFAGAFHACGIEKRTKGTICWGDRTYNQSSPPDRTVQLSSMALGLYHSCGIRSDNRRLVCWGDDRYSQVSSLPVDEPFSSISAADLYTCGLSLRDLQTVKCWGNSLTNFTALNSTRVSQGLCTSANCSSQQFELSRNATGGGPPCPTAGDRICLDCPTESGAIDLEDARSCPCSLGAAPDSPSSSSKKTGVIVASSLAGAAVVIGLFVTAWYAFLRRGARKKRRQGKLVGHWQRLVAFSSSELRLATSNFADDRIIGRGAQGVVYRGVFPDGQLVAVKKEADHARFQPELELLGRLHHTCLVNLIGYCFEDCIFVYEFMQNGSLYDCLFKTPNLSLDWVPRIRIAAQAARGLEYLHTYASPKIIHRDVKSANILLDRDWNAHVSDFGLSTFGPQQPEATHLSSITVVGTPGYLDPEYWKTSKLNAKSDVYSFGVVLLELLCGRKAREAEVSLVMKLVEATELPSFSSVEALDEKLLADRPSKDHADRLFGLAIECTRDSSKDRPPMGEVAARLEAILSELSSSASSSTKMSETLISSASELEVR